MKIVTRRKLKKDCQGNDVEKCLNENLQALQDDPSKYNREELQEIRRWARGLVNLQPTLRMTASDIIEVIDQLIGPEVSEPVDLDECLQVET